jgi:proline dehydrogenase
MEESRYVDATLEVYRRAKAEWSNVGVCLQAYLRRTPADLEALLPLAPAIRLVKGAYNEPAELAFPKKRGVDAAYVALAQRLLQEAARQRVKPVFGTHDLGLVERIRQTAAEQRVNVSSYEFHMLYGIRAEQQRKLASQGAEVRVLISYGSAWFAWYMRRLAERPANVWFVLRNVV